MKMEEYREEIITKIVSYYKDISTGEELEEMINNLRECSTARLKRIRFDAFCEFFHKNTSVKKRKTIVAKKKNVKQLRRKLNLVQVV